MENQIEELRQITELRSRLKTFFGSGRIKAHQHVIAMLLLDIVTRVINNPDTTSILDEEVVKITELLSQDNLTLQLNKERDRFEVIGE